jgi:hyperosmotically inducible protein
MFKKLSVVLCGAAVVLTAAAASAQTATQEAKDKTYAAAQKTAEVVTDAEITSAVKTKLLADTTVGGLKIDVDTKNGVVTLTGPVNSGAEKTQALHLAKETKGVKKVVSKLTMATAGTSGQKDKDIGDKTKDAAEKTAKATKDGVETAGKATKDAAVKTEDVVADATVTSMVKTKLLGDPKVGGLKIDVDTKDNVVTLTGTVNSVEEKSEALRLAKNTTGVKRVVDKLTVK